MFLFNLIISYFDKWKIALKVNKIKESEIYIKNENDSDEVINADAIITAFGMKSDNEFYNAIKTKYYEKTKIAGDCEKVGKVGTAVRSGFYAALSI